MNNTNIGIETKGCPSYGGKYITINPKASITTNTLENLCTRTAQSSRGVRSRRVHKIYYFGLL